MPLLAIVLVFISQIVILLYISDFFRIKTIKSDRYIGPVFFTVGGKAIVNFDKKDFIDRIKKENPQILEVELYKKYPGQINIKTKLREPVFKAVDRNGEAQYLGDKQGVLYQKAKNGDKNLPEIKTQRISLKIGAVLDKPEEEAAIKIAINFKEEGLILEKIETEKKQVFAYIKGIKVIFPVDFDIEKKLRALQLLLKRFTIEGRVPEIIDLRFDKPVVKYSL